MKKFLIKIAFFFTPILVGICMLEIMLRNIPNNYSYKNAYLEKHANEIEALIIGTSYTYRGVDPKFISTKNSFNASYLGQSIDLDVAIFDKFKFRLDNLEYLIIPVGYVDLFYKLSDTKDWRIKNYIIYYDLDIPHSFWDNFAVLDPLSRSLKRAGSYYVLNHLGITCSKLGFETRTDVHKSIGMEQSGREQALKQTLPTSNGFIENENFKLNMQTLNKLINYSKEKNIKLIFVTTPNDKSFVKYMDEKQLEFSFKIIQSLVNHNQHVYYYNFLNDKDFTKNDFFDAQHLNANGAKKFTLKLSHIIKQIDENSLKKLNNN